MCTLIAWRADYAELLARFESEPEHRGLVPALSVLNTKSKLGISASELAGEDERPGGSTRSWTKLLGPGQRLRSINSQ